MCIAGTIWWKKRDDSIVASVVSAGALCYSLGLPTHIAACKAATAKEKEGLDDERKTPHNLASLLLTNTTLRSDSGRRNIGSLTINSR